MEYSKKILTLFDDPKYFGSMPADSDVYETQVSSALNTTFVKLYLKINHSSIIEDARYLVNGCPVLIACCEMCVKLVLGKPVKYAREINYFDISISLEIIDLKLHCAIQVEETLYSVLTKYLEKT